jgi:hypothetical protein
MSALIRLKQMYVSANGLNFVTLVLTFSNSMSCLPNAPKPRQLAL